MNLGLFELTMYLTDDAFELEVFAGQDRAQVQSPQDRFRIVQPMRSEIVREILLKLERALARDEKAIDVNVQNSREIVRDPKFPLPPAAQVTGTRAATPALSTRGLGDLSAIATKIEVSKHRAARAKRGRHKVTTTAAHDDAGNDSVASPSGKAGSSKNQPKQNAGTEARDRALKESPVKASRRADFVKGGKKQRAEIEASQPKPEKARATVRSTASTAKRRQKPRTGEV